MKLAVIFCLVFLARPVWAIEPAMTHQCLSLDPVVDEINGHRPPGNPIGVMPEIELTDFREVHWMAHQLHSMSEVWALAAATILFMPSMDYQSYGVFLRDADGCVFMYAVVPRQFLEPILYVFGQLRYDGYFGDEPHDDPSAT